MRSIHAKTNLQSEISDLNISEGPTRNENHARQNESAFPHQTHLPFSEQLNLSDSSHRSSWDSSGTIVGRRGELDSIVESRSGIDSRLLCRTRVIPCILQETKQKYN